MKTKMMMRMTMMMMMKMTMNRLVTGQNWKQ